MDIKKLGEHLHLDLIEKGGIVYVTRYHHKYIEHLYSINDSGILSLYNSFKNRYTKKTHEDFINNCYHIVNIDMEKYPMELNFNNPHIVPLLRRAKIDILMGK